MTTWNPADKAAPVTLSNGNLTAITGFLSDYVWARSTVSRNSGKLTFECTADDVVSALEYAAAGVGVAGADIDDYLGQGANDAAYYANGDVYNGNAVTATLASYTDGDVIGCHLDHALGKGWFSKNGVFASGDPAAGTGEHFTFTPGTALFAGFTLRDNPEQITANFGATAFAFPAPTGFTGWDAAALEGSDYFGNAYFGSSYFGGYYWGPQSGVAPGAMFMQNRLWIGIRISL